MKILAVALFLFVSLSSSVESVLAQDDLERSVALMGKIGSATSPSFSPDGKTLAFVSNLNGIPQVWTMPASGGFPKLVTAFDDPVGFVTWSPDGRWLAFNVAPGGGLNEQIYVARPDGSELRRLTEGGKENNFLGDWTRDGKYLFFSSNRRNPASTDSYLLDAKTGERRMVAENKGTGGINEVSRDGRRAIVSRLLNRGNNNLYLIDVESGKESLLTPHEGPGSFGGAQFTPDGRTIYFASNKDRDLLALARVVIDENGQPGAIETVAVREDGELSSGIMSDDGAMMVLNWNIGGRSELAFYDVKNNRMMPGPKLPAEIAGGFDFTDDGKRLAMVLSGAASPADIWKLDLGTKQFTRLTDSPHAGVDLTKMVRPELVEYTAHDGLKLSGWLYKPHGAKGSLPIVLSFHGGPEGQERPGFNSTYQALLMRGIAVFAPNVRGSSGFGKKFVNLDNGALRENGVKDIKATVDYVVKSGVADPKRIGIMGGSYGGYMVMAGLTEYPELFAA
ncbi:MAG: prolyl oligopeptidase family serine peptidase, partial [Acidobacteria bacterium]|nr:prolyl oligopeptidase family serine peptidase [Acidobacteriota bacterium]MCA1637386.1 prolyl oligopeptidase family serine peptidase [Acidobacteriota bacterium]